MKSVILIIFLAITCADIKAQVIDYSIDAEFNSGSAITHGSVSDIVHTTHNTFLVMGMFSHQSQIEVGAFYSSSGQPLGGVTIAGPFAAQYRNGYLQYGSGLRMFDEVNPYPNHNFQFEFQKSAYSNPFSCKALDILIMENDQVLVAGRFATDTTLFDTPIESQGLRQLCLIDSTGSPVPDFPMVHCAQPVDAEIYSIDIQSNGQYIIAGIFDEVNGYPYKNIARLNADFSVDTTFTNQLLSILATTKLIDSQDRIWVGCVFGGSLQFNPDSVFLYTRLLPSGEPDTTFTGSLLQTWVGQNEDILQDVGPYDIIEDEDGTFIFGGNFVYANGDYHKTLLKIQEDGSIIDEAFANLGADSAIWGAWEPPLGQIRGTHVSNILKLPDGNLIIGGRFSSFGGEPYNCLVKLKPDGFVGLEEKPLQSKLILYPNPSNDSVRLELPIINQKIESVFIYDLKGVLVKKVNLNMVNPEIDISDLTKGVYILQANTKATQFSQKLVKY